MSRDASSISSLNKFSWFLVSGFWLLASGCGFQPLYGKHSGTSDVLSGVAVEPIGGRIGQQLRIALEDRLNPGGAVPPLPGYRLEVTLATSESAIGVARDGTVSRYNVHLTSQYTLYRTRDSQQLAAGALNHVSSYNNITNQYFSTYVSKEDAVERGLSELADLYRQRLAAYLAADPADRPVVKTPPKPLVNTGT